MSWVIFLNLFLLPFLLYFANKNGSIYFWDNTWNTISRDFSPTSPVFIWMRTNWYWRLKPQTFNGSLFSKFKISQGIYMTAVQYWVSTEAELQRKRLKKSKPYCNFSLCKCSDPSPRSWATTDQCWHERPGKSVCVLKKRREHLQIGNFLWREGVSLLLRLTYQGRCSTSCQWVLFSSWSAAD